MITIGDKSIPADGVNDDSDSFDAPEGTCATANNILVGRNDSSWQNRGGLSKDIDPPSVGNGLQSGMVIQKVLCTRKWRVTKPSDQLCTFMAAVVYSPCGQNNAGSVGARDQYMLRFFMSPSYTSPSFNGPTTWKEVTPFYIDIVEPNQQIVLVSGTHYYCPTTTITSSMSINPYDLDGGYIYAEDTANWTNTQLHLAEGDKLAIGSNMYWDASTQRMHFDTANMNAANIVAAPMDTTRFHKNLETGKLNYFDISATTDIFSGVYTVSANVLNEKLLVSVHSGSSSRASFTLQLNYIKNTFFDTSLYVGNIWSRLDFIYDIAGDPMYDKHLVYGFPNYDNINKANTSAVFDGKTVDAWNNNTKPTAGAGTYTATLANGSYDKYKGRMSCTANTFVAGPKFNLLYRISNCDLKIVVDDFLMSEFDVHGRYGTWRDFEAHTLGLSSQTTIMASTSKTLNFLETFGAGSDGAAKTTSETAYVTPKLLHVVAMMVYDGFRFGMHSELYQTIQTTDGTLIIAPKIPASFNRNITHLCLSTTDELAFVSSSITSLAVLSGSMMFNNSLLSDTGWDFRTTFVNAVGDNVENSNFCYTKSFRQDKTKRSNTNIGGNHLSLTGNPGYSKKLIDEQTKKDLILSVDGTFSSGLGGEFGPTSVLALDFSFGAKYSTIVRDRLFIANVKFQEHQMNLIQSTIFTDTSSAFFSPIGQFGGNYHIFDAATNKLPLFAREMGALTGVAAINLPQSLEGASQPDKTSLIMLAEGGYKFIDLADNDQNNWFPITYQGDCCVAPLSVTTENGIVFCAGNNGVYLFSGPQKQDITFLGNSAINKTWRAISRANKQTAIGAYYRDRKIYMLAVPATNQIFCFDLNKKKIFTFSHASASHFAKLIGMQYVTDTLYFYFNNGVISKYDETVTQDWDGSSNTNFTCTLTLNNLHPDANWVQLNSFGIGYSAANAITVSPVVDDVTPYGNSEIAGTKNYFVRRFARAFSGRGRAFALTVATTSGTVEVFDIELAVSDVPQKRMVTEIK